MPGMTQCADYSKICQRSPSSNYCKPAGTTTGTVSAASEYCTKSGDFCVQGMPGKSPGESCFRIKSRAKGWLGFGIGSTMAGADMYIAHKDKAGNLIVGNYLGSGPVMPAKRSTSSVTSVTPGTDFSFDFCRNEASNCC